jgi:hypothetical protein
MSGCKIFRLIRWNRDFAQKARSNQEPNVHRDTLRVDGRQDSTYSKAGRSTSAEAVEMCNGGCGAAVLWYNSGDSRGLHRLNAAKLPFMGHRSRRSHPKAARAFSGAAPCHCRPHCSTWPTTIKPISRSSCNSCIILAIWTGTCAINILALTERECARVTSIPTAKFAFSIALLWHYPPANQEMFSQPHLTNASTWSLF